MSIGLRIYKEFAKNVNTKKERKFESEGGVG